MPLYKVFIVAEASPHITKQRITAICCSLGVPAAVSLL